MKTELFPVPSAGIGRKDYSQGIEYATQASFKGHQIRANWTLNAVLPTVPYPDAWGIYLLFKVSGVWVTVAPSTPHHVYKITVTSERNCLVTAGLCRFASLADVAIWNVEKWYGDMFGYGAVELLYTLGMKTVKGKVYVVTFSEYSGEPTMSIHVNVSALKEEVVYG
jgi:hypothetical protein